MKTRLWTVVFIALLFGLSSAGLAVAQEQLTPADIDATIAALEQQKAELESQTPTASASDVTEVGEVAMVAASAQLPTVGLDGQPLRQPTTVELADMQLAVDATWQDCKAAVETYSPEHRWGFVGACEGALAWIIDKFYCPPDGFPEIYTQQYPDINSSDEETQAAAWQELDDAAGAYYMTLDRYKKRLAEEWLRGDVPLGISSPEQIPDVQQAVIVRGCWVPPS